EIHGSNKNLMKFLYPILAIMLIGCTVKKTDSTDQVKSSSNTASGTGDFEYMDLKADPTGDFYTYANGTWLTNNPVPASETKWSSFNELKQNNYTPLKEILEDAIVMESKKGSIDQLIGDFYFTFMDSTTRNELGVSPIMPYLD